MVSQQCATAAFTEPVVNTELGHAPVVPQCNRIVMQLASSHFPASQRYCELRGALYKHLEDSFGEAAQYVYGAFEDKRPVEAFRLTWSASGYEAAGQNLATLRK